MILSFGSLISRLWLILVIALVPTAVMVVYNGWTEYQDAREEMRKEAAFYVGKLAENQQRHILETQDFLKNLAAFNVLQNPSSAACGKALEGLLSLHPIYVNLGVPLANGELLCNGFELDHAVNVSDREYFRSTIDRGVFSIGSYQLDRAAKVPSINMAYPVRSQQTGEIIAAAVAVVSLSWWSQQLTDYGIHSDSLALVIDHHDLILASHGGQRPVIGAALSELGLQTLKTVKGQTGTISITAIDGIERLYAYTPLHQKGDEVVMVVVGLPSYQILNTLNEHLRHDIEAIVLAILLLAIMAGWAARATLVQPIRSLLKSTDMLAEDLDVNLPAYHGSELATLAERFQFIVEQRLKASEKLQNSQAELRLAYIRLESLLSEAPVGVIEWDAESRVSRWSGISNKLFGIDEKTVLGLKVDSWPVMEHQSLTVSSTLDRIRSGESANSSCVSHLRKNDKEVWTLSWSFTPIRDEKGGLVAVLSLVEDITEEIRQQQELEFRASFDHLTGLPNRYQMIEQLERLIGEGKTQFILVALLDLDNFKLVNDTLGHEVGDRYIFLMADRLRKHLQDGEIVGRLGGDEFLFIKVTDSKQIGIERVEALQLELKKPINLGKVVNSCEASAGLAFYPEDGANSSTLIKHADLAMYDSKRQRRGGIGRFSWNLELAGRIRFELESELNLALENDKLQLYYQPIVCAKSGKVKSAEVLLRWPHPDKGMVPPDQFIPIAEECGLIVQLGRWVLERALKQLAQWQEQGVGLENIAVNLSAWQLHDERLPQFLQETLGRLQLKPQQLTLELTESAVINADSWEMTMLNKLSDMGVTFSLDDFGTGYSSLSYLTRIPLQRLKIDRSFVNNLDKMRDQKLLAGIVAMAKGIGLEIVAEGVETEQQLTTLRTFHCDLIQGYYYSKPVPSEDFEACLKSCLHQA